MENAASESSDLENRLEQCRANLRRALKAEHLASAAVCYALRDYITRGSTKAWLRTNEKLRNYQSAEIATDCAREAHGILYDALKEARNDA